jgi:hypothetical protein
MTPFETILLEELARVKEKLRQDETLSGLTLTITATGRMDGELSVTFAVADYYGGKSVEAGSLAPAIAEFLRRRGWNARHAPLCLPNVRAREEAGGRSTLLLPDPDEVAF